MFLAPALDTVSQQKLNEIKEQMGSLERVLEEDVARQTRPKGKVTKNRKPSVELPGEGESNSESEGVVPEDEKYLEPTPLATADAHYGENTSDDMLDLGVKVGKMRYV